MAAVILSPLASYPSGYTHTLATTWQEFVTDPRSRVITVENRHASIDIYVAFDSMGDPASPETPTDGGAVGTHYSTVPAGGSRVYRLREDNTGRHTSGSVFIAGASGSPVCYVEQAKGPA